MTETAEAPVFNARTCPTAESPITEPALSGLPQGCPAGYLSIAEHGTAKFTVRLRLP